MGAFFGPVNFESAYPLSLLSVRIVLWWGKQGEVTPVVLIGAETPDENTAPPA